MNLTDKLLTSNSENVEFNQNLMGEICVTRFYVHPDTGKNWNCDRN